MSARSAPGMVATVVCPAPRVLPLNPQVVFGLSAIGRLPFLRRLPLFGSCCRDVVGTVVSALSVRRAQSVSASISFRASGCGAGSLLTAFSIVRNRRDRAPTLARSNNYRCSPPTAFARIVRNPDRWGVTRLAVGFTRPRHFVCRVAGRARLPPHPPIRNAEKCDLLRGNG